MDLMIDFDGIDLVVFQSCRIDVISSADKPVNSANSVILTNCLGVFACTFFILFNRILLAFSPFPVIRCTSFA
jgi:hypothetical protein